MMKTLITLRDSDVILGSAVVGDSTDFNRREASRAVVSDSDGKIALLYVGLDTYHKLPGGGIDPGEDVRTALERELLEEIGCRAEVTGEIGETIEYRNELKLLQTSFCFTATQVGVKGEPDFTEKELREQYSIVWTDSVNSAIELLEQDEPKSYVGKFIQKRDLAILKAVNDQ